MDALQTARRIRGLPAVVRAPGASVVLAVSPIAGAGRPPAVVSLASITGSQGWTLDGPEFLARAGASTYGDCDIDGDGNADLLIGATGAGPSDQGMAFVVFGTAGGLTPPQSLNSAGLRITGELIGDSAGASIACAGDVDADGFDDLLIGAPLADAAGLSSGTVYLVYGGESLPSTIALSALTAATGMRIHGIGAGHQLGAVIAGGRDVNGDGYTDIVLTAPNVASGASNPGQAYVIFGSASFPASFALGTLNGTNGFAVASSEASTLSLGGAAALGDVNGDNYPDVVLGAPGAAPGNQASAGSVFVVYGHGGSFVPQVLLNTLTGANGFSIHGAIAGGSVGGSLGVVPDFNGDARADLVIGAPGAANGTGAIGHGYVLFGAAGFAANVDLAGLNGTNGVRLTSPAAGDVLGRSVAGLHDVNGDGLGEVMLGAPGADFGASDAGGAYVVYGRRSGLPADIALASLDGGTGFRIQGAFAGDFAGQSVARVGDVDRDGFADLVIAAPEADPNSVSAAGRIVVLFGDDLIFRDGFQ
jgi:hypothetical protein